MAQIRRTSVRIEGLEKVLENIPKRDRSIRTTLGIAIRKFADKTIEGIRELAPEDTGTMKFAFTKIHPESFQWIVGDFNYPPGIVPYAVYHHFGARRHWIHRSQINPLTSNPKLQEFLASDREFIQVGPISPNPFITRAITRVQLTITPELNEKIRNAMKV